MPRDRYVILQAEGRWQAAAVGATSLRWQSVDGGRAEGREDLARRIAEALRQLGYDGRPACLALGTEDFLWAAISTDGLVSTGRRARRADRQALLYRMEEELPVDAEDLTADFIESDGRALGVGVLTSGMLPLLDALQAAGVEIELIVPRSMFALEAMQTMARSGASDQAQVQDPSAVTAALLAADDRLELWWLRDGRPIENRRTADPAECARALAAGTLLGRDTRGVLLCDGRLPADVREAVRRQWAGEVRLLEETDWNESAARTAAECLGGRRSAWVNLRRDGLAAPRALKQVRRPLIAAAVLTIVLLAVAAAGMLWRAHRYRQAAETALAAQRQVYAALNPGQAVPPSVRMRLESDWRRTGSLRGLGTDLPRPPSALETLREVVRRLPGDRRLRLLEIRLQPDAVFLDGQSRTHADAEAVAAALAAGGLLQMDPPRTESLVGGGASFVLNGRLVQKTETNGPAPEVRP